MYFVSAFYKFKSVSESQVEHYRQDFYEYGITHRMLGLIILGTEGVNGTVAASDAAGLSSFKDHVQSLYGDLTFKDSQCEQEPFKRWSIKTRPEIVSLGDPSVIPDGKHNHLSPDEWDEKLASEDVVLIDTRNSYETVLGTFEGAVDPEIEKFSEFPEWVDQSGIEKDKTVLMYCTGGIRCEKAIYTMQQRGYEKVFQLDGGILNYLKEKPDGRYQGECFVFDDRVAVDSDLKPSSQFKLCAKCGVPGDVRINCHCCDVEAVICRECDDVIEYPACSKDCEELVRRGVSRKQS